METLMIFDTRELPEGKDKEKAYRSFVERIQKIVENKHYEKLFGVFYGTGVCNNDNDGYFFAKIHNIENLLKHILQDSLNFKIEHHNYDIEWIDVFSYHYTGTTSYTITPLNSLSESFLIDILEDMYMKAFKRSNNNVKEMLKELYKLYDCNTVPQENKAIKEQILMLIQKHQNIQFY